MDTTYTNTHSAFVEFDGYRQVNPHLAGAVSAALFGVVAGSSLSTQAKAATIAAAAGFGLCAAVRWWTLRWGGKRTSEFRKHLEQEDPADDVEGADADAGMKRPARRAHGGEFVKRWVEKGKVMFPAASSNPTQADWICICRGLSRAMAEANVRDRDIAKFIPRIACGVLRPNREEVIMARMMESKEMDKWRRDGVAQRGHK